MLGWLIPYLMYVIVASLGLAAGTTVIYWVVDKCTPYLPFDNLSKEKPYLMIGLIVAILLCLTWLMKAFSVRVIPVP